MPDWLSTLEERHTLVHGLSEWVELEAALVLVW